MRRRTMMGQEEEEEEDPATTLPSPNSLAGHLIMHLLISLFFSSSPFYVCVFEGKIDQIIGEQ